MKPRRHESTMIRLKRKRVTDFDNDAIFHSHNLLYIVIDLRRRKVSDYLFCVRLYRGRFVRVGLSSS